jgi:hypothetical protein
MESVEHFFSGDIVTSLTRFFESDFNTQREQWESALLSELKLTEVGNKSTKKMLDGKSWPTLSLSTPSEVQLPASEWKKAAITYGHLNLNDIEAEIADDLKSGVRNFFFHAEALDEKKWKLIEKQLKGTSDVEVFILGAKFESTSVKVIGQIISGQEAHDQGAHSIQELALLSKNLIQNLDQTGDIYLGVYVDSHFFHSIAKIRAAKLLAHKILAEAKSSRAVKIVALTSYVGWSVFERYSNMLRNETAVAAAYIGGADHIQSAGYNTLLELETENFVQDEHVERSRRMARNTSHVLALESMLGVVEDAAFGSFHLESLTQGLCEDSWKLMQSLLSGVDMTADISKVREQRLSMIKTRKSIMSGINDYPDMKEHLNLKLKASKLFRVARPFEELRLKMNSMKKPEVCVALYGDYGALNARLNFVKNYFELLGLTVHESFERDLSRRKEEIIVLCALDDQYPNLNDVTQTIKSEQKFIAGKFEMTGFKNLHAGQNVYEVLESIVTTFQGRQA